MSTQGMYRTSDPETSKQAAESLSLDFTKSARAAVLEFFMSRKDATDAELEQELGRAYPGFSTLRKRRGELVAAGSLEFAHDWRKNPANGAWMRVWRIRYAEAK